MAAAHALLTRPESARREVEGVTAGIERRVLTAIAARLPRRIQSDHLTALGFAGLLGCGVAYAASGERAFGLHVANLGLAANWLGDSLDGTLARVRRQERPRYGFYIDHMVDAIGAVAVVGGLAAGGLASPAVAAAVLVAFLLVSIHVHLTTYATGLFKISWGPIGVSELRLLLVAANLAAFFRPTVMILGTPFRFFDVLGSFVAAGLAAVLAIWVPGVSVRLRAEDAARLVSGERR